MTQMNISSPNHASKRPEIPLDPLPFSSIVRTQKKYENNSTKVTTLLQVYTNT